MKLQIEWQGEAWECCSQRALFRPRTESLFVADAHFGKDMAFRHAGIPIPHGAVLADLARLKEAIDETAARRVVILGDFFHARTGLSGVVMQALGDWFKQHAGMDILLVRGNHDKGAGDPPVEWNIRVSNEPAEDHGVILCHRPIAAERPTLAGHVHPGIVLFDRDGSRLRLPCFHVARHSITLPAFGTFTGMFEIEAAEGDRIVVVHEGVVAEVKGRR